MEFHKKMYHHSEHVSLGQRTTFPKFQVVQQSRPVRRQAHLHKHTTADSEDFKSKHHRSAKDLAEIDDNDEFFQNQKGYMGLSKKLEEKRKMQVGTRHFNKSFYSKLSSKIAEKPLTFYKFGLRQEEKKTCGAVFKQLFKIEPQRLKGSLSVAQLWDNKTSVKFLKQNQMFFNKDILIQQFQNIDKQQKQRKRAIQLQKQKQFVRKFRQTSEYNRKLNENNIIYQQVRQMDAKEACSYIRTEIDKLIDKKQYKKDVKWRKPYKTSSRKIIAGLEKDYDKFDQIANKFNNNMIVLL